MKQLLSGFFFIFLFTSINAKAQQNHFIYIQTDNKQSFYVRQDKNVYSSTASGYLVLSKLKEGTYTLVFGFPKNEWAEQSIHCTIEDTDLGYLLKNFGDKGWGLFNLQSLKILMAADSNKKNEVSKEVTTDAFSNMLSTVVNDPSIKEAEPVKKEIKKPVTEEIKPEVALYSSLQKEEEKKVVTEAQKIDSPKSVEQVVERIAEINKADKVNITKKLSSKTAEGLEMVFIDIANGTPDTVSILIPIEKDIVESTPEKTFVAINDKPKEIIKVKESESIDVLKEEKSKGARFLEMELPNPNVKQSEFKTDSVKQRPVSKSPMINSDCKNFATNEDFLKLRKKMAAVENPEDMVITAKKVFKTKCFTTAQLKNLSVLFLKDAGRYSFFDTAYPFVSDSQNYSLLEEQLTETYYINRFRVMIKH